MGSNKERTTVSLSPENMQYVRDEDITLSQWVDCKLTEERLQDAKEQRESKDVRDVLEAVRGGATTDQAITNNLERAGYEDIDTYRFTKMLMDAGLMEKEELESMDVVKVESWLDDR